MTEPPHLSSQDEAELQGLCAAYEGASRCVMKSLHFGNPPEVGKVLAFVQEEAKAAAIINRIKEILMR